MNHTRVFAESQDEAVRDVRRKNQRSEAAEQLGAGERTFCHYIGSIQARRHRRLTWADTAVSQSVSSGYALQY